MMIYMVLVPNTDHELFLYFERTFGVTQIEDLMTLSFRDINNIPHSNDTKPLHLIRIKLFMAYFALYSYLDNNFRDRDISIKDYNTFRINGYFQNDDNSPTDAIKRYLEMEELRIRFENMKNNTNNTNTSNNNNNNNTNNNNNNNNNRNNNSNNSSFMSQEEKNDKAKLDQFSKSIKRSVEDYEEFKNEATWDRWNSNFKVTLINHDCKDMINPNYTPPNEFIEPQKYELYIKKQAFLYSVFQKKLLTDFGRSLVRQHREDMNARQLYFSLEAHMKNSSVSRITSQKLMSFVAGYRIHMAVGKFTY